MIAFSIALTFAVAGIGPGPAPRTGEEVIRAMYDKYNKTWYRQLSFVQRAIFPGQPEEVWWEALKIPGRLRIDVAPVDSGIRTVTYRGDSLYAFAQKKLANKANQPNLLLVLGFDVYGQPAESRIAVLKTRAVRPDEGARGNLGRPTALGGGRGAGRSRQQPVLDRQGAAGLSPLNRQGAQRHGRHPLTKYQRLGGGWIGTEVHFFQDGKEYFTEIYRDWKINPAVTEDLFYVGEWKRPAWVPRT